MSSVTERFQANGTWSIDLVDETPPDIRQALRIDPASVTNVATKGFAVCVVTDQRVDPATMTVPANPTTTPHPLLSAARWAGVVTGTEDRRQRLTGEGLLAMLEDSKGSGFFLPGLADRRVQAAPSTLVSRLLDGGTLPDILNPGENYTFPVSPLRGGTISTASGTQVLGDYVKSVRHHLLVVSKIAGRCFRVRPTGHVDWGTRTELWGSGYPRCMIGHGLPSIDDARYVTVRAEGSWSESLTGYAERAYADAPPPPPGHVTTVDYWSTPPSAPSLYTSAIRNASLWRSTEIAPSGDDETITEWGERAYAEVQDINGVSVAATNLTGRISGGTRLEPGEPVWLWDPEVGLIDQANAVTYAGQLIHPTRVNLVAVTWPVVEGMGVYLLYIDHTYGTQSVLELTDHVAFNSNPDAQLEVGRAAPSL